MANGEYAELVQHYYDRYVRAQSAIESMELEALASAQGSKRAQKWLLEDSRTDGGFAYKNLCADRKRYMELIQLYGTLALLSR